MSHAAETMPEGVPTFQRFERPGPSSLTTPIAYLTYHDDDPFSSDKNPLAYVSYQTNYLVWSAGPDGKYDLNWQEFDASATTQTAEFIARYTYDATNGADSRGDIWLTRRSPSLHNVR